MEPAQTPAAPVRGARTVLSDYLSVVGARGASVVLSLVSVIVATQLLGTEGYGRLNYLLVVPYLIVSVGSAWSAAAVLTLGREELERDGTLGLTTWARVVTMAPVILLSGLGIVVARVAFGAYSDYDTLILAMALGFALLLVAGEHVVYLLQAAGQMKLSALAQTFQRLALVLGTGALLIFAPDSGLTTYVLVSVIAAFLILLYTGRAVGRRGFVPARIDRPTVRRLLAFSIPLVTTTLGAFGIRWCDILVIKAYGDFEDVGRYALAYQGYESLMVLTVSAVSVFTPLIVSLNLADRLDVVRDYYLRAVPLVLLVSGVGLGLAVAPTHALVPVVFGDKFGGAADSFVLLYVALQFASAMSLLAAVLLGLERTRALALVTVAGVAINLGLDFALVPSVGIAGAAIATSTANAAMAFWMSGTVARVLGTHPARLISAALPLAAGLVPVLAWPGLAGYLAAPVAAVVVAAILARFTRLVEPEDADLLARLRVPERVAGPLGRAVRVAAGGRA
jgi:O-antigen/teichoic acid export membrane protein